MNTPKNGVVDLASFRDRNRKVIDEKKESNALPEAIEKNNDTLVNSIDNLTNSVDKINNKVKDYTTQFNKLDNSINSVNEKIIGINNDAFNRLNLFASKLNEKIENTKEEKYIVVSSESVIQNKIDNIELEEGKDIVQKLDNIEKAIVAKKPDNVIMREEGIKAKRDENNKVENVKKDKKDKRDNRSFETLNKTMKNGFKKSISLSDTITKFLFKISMRMAIHGAKIAAAIVGVVIAIDMLQLQVRKWFSKNSISETMGGIADTFDDLIEAYKQDGLAGVFKNIGSDLLDGLNKVGESIVYGFGKMLSSILKYIPSIGEKMSKDVEVTTLERYIENTGYMPNEQEIKVLAEHRIEQEKDEKYVKKRMEDMDEDGKNLYRLDLEANQERSQEEIMDVYKKTIEVESRIKVLEKELKDPYIGNIRRNEITEKLDEMRVEIWKDGNVTGSLARSVDEKLYELERVLDEKTIKQEPIKEEERVIEEVEKLEKSVSNVSNNVNNMQINNTQNSTKVIQPIVPVTSTPAPGMGRGGSVP